MVEAGSASVATRTQVREGLVTLRFRWLVTKSVLG